METGLTGSTGLSLASVSGHIDRMRGPGQTAGQATITSARWRARTHARPRVRARNHGCAVLFYLSGVWNSQLVSDN